KVYKPTNNNLRTSLNTSRVNQDNSPRIHRNVGYESERSCTVAGARETVGSSMDYTDDESNDQELEAHYMYMAKIQEVSPDAVNSGPIFDTEPEQKIDQNDEDADLAEEPELLASLIAKLKCEIDESKNQLEAHYMYMAKLQQVSPDDVDSGPIFDKEPEQKVQNNDHYDVFAIDCQHSEQFESVHNTYLIEQDAQNVLIESDDMHYDNEQIEQNDEDVDIVKERELLASLIAKLKCEIDETKNRNTLLETSNKVLVEKLKSEIADFKNKNKSLTEATTNCLR
nr:hypothetical protein [Tanacetum cinerariifolium]